MIQIVKEIAVDVAARNVFQAIVAKQNDSNSRFLKVTLCNEVLKLKSRQLRLYQLTQNGQTAIPTHSTELLIRTGQLRFP